MPQLEIVWQVLLTSAQSAAELFKYHKFYKSQSTWNFFLLIIWYFFDSLSLVKVPLLGLNSSESTTVSVLAEIHLSPLTVLPLYM